MGAHRRRLVWSVEAEEELLSIWRYGAEELSPTVADQHDGAVLALLLLGLHSQVRVWKDHDWSVLRRLYERGYITDPARKAKSVVLTDIGLAEAQRLFEELFCRKDDAGESHKRLGATKAPRQI